MKTNRQFYPSKATIRSHIYKSFVKERFSKIDQEDLLRKVELWKKTSPDDSFAYHPYATYASKVKKKARDLKRTVTESLTMRKRMSE